MKIDGKNLTLDAVLSAVRLALTTPLTHKARPAVYIVHSDDVWYDEEHLPALSAVPGTLAARRYRARDDDPDRTHQYVAVYHLASADVTRGDAWKKAVDTPWSARVRPHFRDHIRILSGRYIRGG